MTEEIFAYIAFGVLVIGACLFALSILFLPQIDRLVEKRKTKPRLIIPNHTTPRAKDHSP